MERSRNLSCFSKFWSNIRIQFLIALSIVRNEVEEIMRVIISIVDINSLCESIYISIHLSMTSDTDQAWVLWTLITEELRPPK